MNQEHRDNEYINLSDIFGAVIRRWWVIVIAAMVFGLAGLIYSTFFVTPLYSASAMMIVDSGGRFDDYVTSDQIRTSTSLVETYSVIICSDAVMGDVIQNLDMQDTYSSTVRNIAVTSVNDTQIMKISVTATSPTVALDVCREITKICPAVIVRVMNAGSVEVVSEASSSFAKVSPNITLNTEKATLGGVILAVVILAVLALLDNKVKTANDIQRENIALLGVIPFYELEGKSYDS